MSSDPMPVMLRDLRQNAIRWSQEFKSNGSRGVARKWRKYRNWRLALSEEGRGTPAPANLPRKLTIANTTVCNLRCFHCSKTLDPVPDLDMDLDLLDRIAAEVFPTLKTLCLTVMGEPLAWRHFDHLLELVERHGVGLEMFTNGLLLREDDRTRKLLRHLTSLYVSIDAATPETFQTVRCSEKFTKLVDNLRRFRDLRRSTATRPELCVRFNYTLMRRNVEEFPQFVRLAHELGADEVNASHLIVMRKEQNDESLLFHKELCNRVLEEARSVANEVGIRLSQPPAYVLETVAPAAEQATPARNGARVTCPYLWQQSYIGVDGSVMPCCHPHQPVVGNLRDKSFREIWNGPLYREMRARLDTPDPYPCCKNCPVLEQRGTPDNAEAFLQGT